MVFLPYNLIIKSDFNFGFKAFLISFNETALRIYPFYRNNLLDKDILINLKSYLF